MTDKLYESDAYLKSFTATVTGCEARGNSWEITLDRSAFYPEGGGQPGDSGLLGGVSVLDTHARNGDTVHMASAPLAVGAAVTGELNWDERFSRMQQHSGEHIVSGLIHRLHGFDNVGFHMGHDTVTIDISGELPDGQLENIERLANEAVWANLPIASVYPARDELSAIDYRSKKELSGAVRIVTVPDCDVCACCGTHVARTGEIGAIKLLTSQRYKGGVRIWLLCGSRALLDYAVKNREVYEIAALLSVKPGDAAEAVKRLHAENGALAARAASLSSRLLAERAAQIHEGTALVLRFEEEMPAAELRRWCLALSERCQIAAVFAGGVGGSYSYAVGGKAENADMRPVAGRLNAAFAGRGGGSRELVQGTLCGKRAEIEKFFETEML